MIEEMDESVADLLLAMAESIDILAKYIEETDEKPDHLEGMMISSLKVSNSGRRVAHLLRGETA